MAGPSQAKLDDVLAHERGLRRLASSLLRDPADVEDAVQFALVQAVVGRRRPGVPLWPFLRTVLRRHARNLQKFAQRRRAHEQAVPSAEVEPSAADFVAREQLRRRVADAVLALVEPYRTTVWLRWFEELDAGAIAVRMGVPVATVRSRLQRAHAQLAGHLDREFGGRERWAVLALPLSATVGAGFAMKKFACVAFVIVSLTGYLLWPSSAATDLRASAPRDPAPAPAAAAPVPVPSAARHEVVPPPTAAPSLLAIRYADGTPARGLPVWFWRDDTQRPVWSRPVDASRDREVAPGAVNAGGEPEPPPPHATTDGEGRVVLTADPDVVAVSVQYAADQQFSAPLPPGGAAFVLPPLGDVEAGIRNARPEARWSALVGAIVIEADGGRSGYVALRANVEAPGGPGVVRIREHRYELAAADRLHAPMPRGQWAGVELDGHGFDLRLSLGPDGEAIEGHHTHVRAPAVVEAECIGRLGGIAVEVLEPDGASAAVAGHCCLARCTGPDTPFAEEQRKPLAHGASTFDETALPEGARLELTVLLADGEWFRREVVFATADGGPRVVLTRGSGTAPLRAAVGVDTVVRGVMLELRDGAFASVQPARDFFTAALPAYEIDGGDVRVSLAPDGSRSLWVVAADGATGTVAAAACRDGVGTVQWMPSRPVPDLDVAALFRDYGDHTMMSARLQIGFEDGTGRITWFTVAGHRRFRLAEPPPPTWRGLRVPEGLRSRIELYSSDEPDGSGGTTLELAVPR